MRFNELVNEGGWSSVLTQNTVLTPALVASVVPVLHEFAKQFNQYCESINIPPLEMGNPAGSTTYWKRDLENNPTREYGDIDVNVFIPRNKELTPNANSEIYRQAIIDFCNKSESFKTENGQNVIFKIKDDHVQVDLIFSFSDVKEWSKALAPEYNVKGVLCNSVYSAMASALNLSFSSHGVQAKLQNGKPVPFKTIKNVELVTISTNPKTWAMDIARFFDAPPSPLLKANPGLKDEFRVADAVASIKGLAQSLEAKGLYNAQSLLSKIAEIYQTKINTAVNSSKFDKAASEKAIKKAKDTKEILAKKGEQIASTITQ